MIQKYSYGGDENKFKFPHPNLPDFDYSFSGLKTSFLYLIRDELKKDDKFIEENIHDLAASIQKAIIDILLSKLMKAAREFKIKEIAIAGGVSANKILREKLQLTANQEKWNLFVPKFEYCTDNAAMIAITGLYKYKSQLFSNQKIKPYTRQKTE